MQNQQKLLYHSLRQYQLSLPQSDNFEHVIHCLGTLRDDVLCNAGDTPIFAGKLDSQDEVTQYRQCRDWSQLEDWANANSACFKRVDQLDERYETLWEWTSCPVGSPYSEMAESCKMEVGAKEPKGGEERGMIVL